MKTVFLCLTLFFICTYNAVGQGIQFEEVVFTPFVWVQQGYVDFADIDNDNDLDCIISGYNNFGLKAELYRNNGSGIFTIISSTPFDEVTLGTANFVDIDNDSDLDLFISGLSDSGQVAKLYKNDGQGNYSIFSGLTPASTQTGAIEFSDIDNDNDQDVLVTGYNSTGNLAKLYTNDGNGNFTEVLNTPFTPVSSSTVAFADIDNDNDQDVLIAGLTSNPGLPPGISELYKNDGFGNFTLAPGTPFDGVTVGDLAFADIDNDNDQDVIITGYSYTSNKGESRLYTNDGFGNFTLSTNNSFVPVQSSDIEFADVDNDNDQDVLITGLNDSLAVSKLYENDGMGNFSEVQGTPFQGVSYAPSITFGDVNNDNKPDVLITGRNNAGEPFSKLYKNSSTPPVSNENHYEAFISVFPNPTKGRISIQSDTPNLITQIKLSDAFGKSYNLPFTTNSNEILLDLNIASGIYFIEISTKDKKETVKVIKF